MSHFSHKDIVSNWNRYEQAKLRKLRMHRKRFRLIELTTFLCATGLLVSSVLRENKNNYLPEIFAGYIATNMALLYAETQQSKKYKKEAKQLMLEREKFLNRFRH